MGQNQIDNMVATFQYPDLVIPRIEFLNNNVLVAVGDGSLLFFDARRIPTLDKSIEQETEIQSIFFNENYMGLVVRNVDSEETFGISVYDLSGSLVNKMDFSMNYSDIEFLDNNEICIRNNLECAIFTLRGARRFHYNFERPIWKVMSQRGIGRRYLFIMDQVTERVRLR
jgi:hypothetical protein